MCPTPATARKWLSSVPVPAGLSVACRLNQMGYTVTVFDKNEFVGGLLRFGIPNFKLNKAIIDRRVEILEAEGITFKLSTPIDITKLPEGFDAYCVCTGTPVARDLDKVPDVNSRASILHWICCRSRIEYWLARLSERMSWYLPRARRCWWWWWRYGFRLYRYGSPSGCGQCHPDRNHAKASCRHQSCHTLA